MAIFLPINFTDAYFEAASGLTTTGGTVLSGLESLPRSIQPVAPFAEAGWEEWASSCWPLPIPADARRRRACRSIAAENAGADEGQQAHAAHRTGPPSCSWAVCMPD